MYWSQSTPQSHVPSPSTTTAKTMLRISLALLAAATAAAAAAGPVISHVSSGRAAAPNQSFVLAGAGLAGASARLCPLRGGGACLVLPPQPSSWDGGLKVTLPADSRGIGAFSLSACPAGNGACSNETQAQRWTVNAPRVHWALGDDSNAARRFCCSRVVVGGGGGGGS